MQIMQTVIEAGHDTRVYLEPVGGDDVVVAVEFQGGTFAVDLEDTLTPATARAFALSATGLNKNEIGQILFLSEATIKNYYAQAQDRLGVSNGTQAINTAFQRHLFTVTTPIELKKPLSPPENEVLQLIALGRTVNEISLSLFKSESTIKSQSSETRRKMGDIANSFAAVTVGYLSGELAVDPPEVPYVSAKRASRILLASGFEKSAVPVATANLGAFVGGLSAKTV